MLVLPCALCESCEPSSGLFIGFSRSRFSSVIKFNTEIQQIVKRNMLDLWNRILYIHPMRGVLKNKRVYADTSVFGGVFDPEFEKPSRLFFDQVNRSRFDLITSAIVYDEIEWAPDEVKKYFYDICKTAERLNITAEANELRKAYLDAGIVTVKSEDDAMHVALATTGGCSMIVSWNFKHIVHFDKIRQYNAINALLGYDEINIFSPLEVIDYE